MADYRAGDFLNAIARLNKALSLVHDTRRKPTLVGTAYVFLAMAHHQLGQASEARRMLEQVTQLINQMDRRIGWEDWLTFNLVYREAQELVPEK